MIRTSARQSKAARTAERPHRRAADPPSPDGRGPRSQGPGGQRPTRQGSTGQGSTGQGPTGQGSTGPRPTGQGSSGQRPLSEGPSGVGRNGPPSEQLRRARGPRLRTKLALLTCSIVLGLGLGELGLRLAWGGFYLKDAEPYAAPHATRGWANRPNISVVYGEPEFSVTTTHSSRGYRSAEVAAAKGERLRVLVLGDSFTYGIGAEGEETFSAQLEQLDPRLEVINTGVNGYGTGQELLLLREEGVALDPDIVVVAFFWNDVANNVERDAVRFALRDGQLEYPPEIAELPPVSLAPRRHAYLRYSYLYRFVSDRIKTWRFRWRLIRGETEADGARLAPERREPAWRVERAVLREIRDLTESHGAKLLLMVIPEQIQVQPDTQAFGLVEDEYDVQTRIAEIAESEGIALLDPLDPLRADYAASKSPLYYLQDRHWRPRAHRLVAELILREMQRRHWLPQPARSSG